MSDTDAIGAFAIVPCNDLEAALPFWERLGMTVTGGDENYLILEGWGCEVHLRQGDPPPWDVPQNNPFGVFLRTPQVAEIARLMEPHVIRPGGVLRHREWGLYEVALAGPDNLLVRIGWPSDLLQTDQT